MIAPISTLKWLRLWLEGEGSIKKIIVILISQPIVEVRQYFVEQIIKRHIPLGILVHQADFIVDRLFLLLFNRLFDLLMDELAHRLSDQHIDLVDHLRKQQLDVVLDPLDPVLLAPAFYLILDHLRFLLSVTAEVLILDILICVSVRKLSNFLVHLL